MYSRLFVGLCLGLWLLYPSIISSQTLSGYFESGKRTTDEDYEEEDTDDEYTYQEDHLQYKTDSKDRLRYEIAAFHKNRDYKLINTLDNTSNTYQGNLIYDWQNQKNKALDIGVKFKYKTKRFNDSPRNEYDQRRISPFFKKEKKAQYRLKASAGIEEFKYNSALEKNQNTFFGELTGNHYFQDKKINLIGRYKVNRINRKKTFKKRSKQEGTGKVEYQFQKPSIDKIHFSLKVGQRDTKEENDLDIDYDYRFWSASGKTFHRLGKKLQLNFSYQYFTKNYLFYNRDNTGALLEGKIKHTLSNSPRARFWASLTTQHKQVDFPLLPGNNYKKETFELKAVYWQKKNWKALWITGIHFYRYSDKKRNKNLFTTHLAWDKDLWKRDISVIIEGKYRHTDNRTKNDRNRVGLRLSIRYKM